MEGESCGSVRVCQRHDRRAEAIADSGLLAFARWPGLPNSTPPAVSHVRPFQAVKSARSPRRCQERENDVIRKIRLIICEPCRLVYRPLPKCASTTMYGLLASLGGVKAGPRANPRRLLPLVDGLTKPGRGGSYEVIWPLDEAADRLGEAYRGYTVFSVIRDPFDRTLSNYHNKLNRFARRFAPSVYWGGYLGPVFNGRSPLVFAERIRWMQRTIGFDQFVEVLGEQGIAWDSHFNLQVRLLGDDRISYDHLLRLESLASGLQSLLAGRGSAAVLASLTNDLGRLNASGNRPSDVPWTARTRSLVAKMYDADFQRLGYAVRRAA